MKTFVWFVLGIAGGFVVAHLVNKDPRGHELLSQVDARIGEFTDRIGDAYRDQEAQLVDLVAEAKDAASDAAEAAKNATAKLTD
ncbi:MULTISPECIES: ATPase [unclassified Microbacterium]|uniref:ATPase n=1 Tax=unclassified Microbacterium TaxID=2609290 RepID=UPI000D568293|nr:ATPase [Microbacterium sp. Gd 4-13]PVW06651.1 ATPase [Microbacterium sp. Gd 4-13]